MKPNAYMTDEAWANISPNLCKGIRAMKGVEQEFWVLLSIININSFGIDKLLV
jgi:hypothetical protein